jgi:hypothetical protein
MTDMERMIAAREARLAGLMRSPHYATTSFARKLSETLYQFKAAPRPHVPPAVPRDPLDGTVVARDGVDAMMEKEGRRISAATAEVLNAIAVHYDSAILADQHDNVSRKRRPRCATYWRKWGHASQ